MLFFVVDIVVAVVGFCPFLCVLNYETFLRSFELHDKLYLNGTITC